MQIAEVVHAGDPGIWLNKPLAACMLQDLGELKPLRKRVGLLEKSLTLAVDESNDREAANVRLRAAIEHLEAANAGERRLRISAEKDTKRAKRRGKLAGVIAGTAGAGIGALLTFLVLSVAQ